jgi:hypothetical protein
LFSLSLIIPSGTLPWTPSRFGQSSPMAVGGGAGAGGGGGGGRGAVQSPARETDVPRVRSRESLGQLPLTVRPRLPDVPPATLSVNVEEARAPTVTPVGTAARLLDLIVRTSGSDELSTVQRTSYCPVCALQAADPATEYVHAFAVAGTASARAISGRTMNFFMELLSFPSSYTEEGAW